MAVTVVPFPFFTLTNDPTPMYAVCCVLCAGCVGMLCCVLDVCPVKSPCQKSGWQDGLGATLLLFYLNFLVIFSISVQERFDEKAKAIIP